MGNPHAAGAAPRRTAEAIERGGTGKLTVADLLANAGASGSPVAAPAADVGSWNAERLVSVISAVAGRILGKEVDRDTDLFDAGATSVTAVEIAAALAREHDLPVELDDLFADARPRQLAHRWLAARGTPAPAEPSAPARLSPAVDETLVQIMADVARADSLPFVGAPPPDAPRRLLLTGATGFLGSHLLLDLLRHSDAHVVCLVRAENDEAALRRLAEGLTRFHLPWSAEVARRVTALAGDFRRPMLGLSAERWAQLADEVDAIVNVGAAVDFLRGYPSLRQSNVLGPLMLAELAMTGRIKPLHHVSSVAVFNELGIGSMGEDDPVAHLDRLSAGYDQTKWAAEAVLRRAREHGLVVTLLRPAGIGGHPDTGAHNGHDFSSAFVAAYSRFGTLPAFRYLNVAAVDWVSRMAAAIVGEPDAWGRTYHLTGVPRSLDEVVRDMTIGGMIPRVQHWDRWRDETLTRIREEPVPELEFLARMLQSPTAARLCEAQLSAPAARCDRTLAFAAGHGLPAATPYDGRAQRRTLEELARSGVARLSRPGGTPYLWFRETMDGEIGAVGDKARTPCALALRLSIQSMYQLVTERRIDVSGDITCALLHTEPLTVVAGSLRVRPQEGIPVRNGLRHPLMRYRLELRDADGRQWWLAGTKTARAGRDLLRQTRTVTVEVGRDGEAASHAGEVAVPVHSYLPDQVDGLRVDPALPERDRRRAKLIWLGWFNLQVGRGLLEPPLRAAAELLDLRRGATHQETRR
ncbi:thioester reductase domain-containing protein [Streptomyces sp. NPDC004296]|uniref:thioester reductase domain-containing protein n=1 Tax=Streptomyces sp. NPDC004296 TaxID=3364697 RepID=UPI0036C621B2